MINDDAWWNMIIVLFQTEHDVQLAHNIVILRLCSVEICLLALLSIFLVIVLLLPSFVIGISFGALIIIIVFPVTIGEQLQADCGRSPQFTGIPLISFGALIISIL